MVVVFLIFYYALFCSGFIIACFAQHSSLLIFKNLQMMKGMFIIFKVFHFICHVFLWSMWERKKKSLYLHTNVTYHSEHSYDCNFAANSWEEWKDGVFIFLFYFYFFTIICDGFWIWVAIIELWHDKSICKGTDIICNLAKRWMGSVL